MVGLCGLDSVLDVVLEVVEFDEENGGLKGVESCVHSDVLELTGGGVFAVEAKGTKFGGEGGGGCEDGATVAVTGEGFGGEEGSGGEVVISSTGTASVTFSTEALCTVFDHGNVT